MVAAAARLRAVGGGAVPSLSGSGPWGKGLDIPTVGPYNPDWAICWDDHDHPRLHLVRETKSTKDEAARRSTENAKIACAKEHFAALATGYGVATRFDDMIEQIG